MEVIFFGVSWEAPTDLGGQGGLSGQFEEVIIFRDKQTLYRNINIIIFSKLTTYHLRVLGSLKYFGGQTRGVGLKNISARKVKFKFFLSAPTRT